MSRSSLSILLRVLVFALLGVAPVAHAQTLGITPSSGSQLTTAFTVSGVGYTANATVRRFINQPAWGGFREISSIQADGTGHISWTYTPTCADSIGNTLVYVIDGPTNRQSPTVTEVVQAHPSCTPVITSLSPATPTAGPQDQTVTVLGNNFLSGLTVTVTYPGGSSVLSGGQIQNVTPSSFVMLITLGSAGQYTIRVTNPSLAQSNAFTFTAGSSTSPLTLGITPSSGSQLTTAFTVSGAGYTANATVRRFINQPAWGGFREISTTQADGSGHISWTYTPTCADSIGNTLVYVIDGPTNRQSPTVTEVVQVHPSCTPAITGISPATPTAGPQDQSVTVLGNNFLSGLTVTVTYPGGSSVLSGAQIQNVTPSSFVMLITLGGAGQYTIRANNPNLAPSNSFTFAANTPPATQTLSITPSTGTQLTTTFVVTGHGYQPNGVVRRYISQPTWGGYREISTVRATSTGDVSWNYLADCTHVPGTTSMYVVDDQSHLQSNIVSFSVVASSSCQAPTLSVGSVTPAQAPRGQATTFRVTGTGFDPGFRSALVIDGQTWNIPALQFNSATSIEITPFIGGGATTTAEIQITSAGQQASFSFAATGGGDDATFVADVGLQDGASVSQGAGFTKTWRLRNTGGTTWGGGYSLAFVDRERLGAPASVPVPVTSSGATADISVFMTAPQQPGTHQGFWRMRNPAGGYFGPQIWVSIVVPGSTVPPTQILVALTHGLQSDSVVHPEFPAMQTRISDFIRDSGRSAEVFGDPLLFNWSTQSNNDGYGWAAAAGDQLFATLAERLHDRPEVSVHLIGHSLGGTVIDQAAMRLIQYGFAVKQVTFVDAVSSKEWWSNPPIKAWNGIERVDNYYGTGCFVVQWVPSKFYMPVGRIDPLGSAHDVFRPERDHSGGCPPQSSIVAYYADSIKTAPAPSEQDGWYWAPLGDGIRIDTTLPGTSTPPARADDPGPAETVLNGDFSNAGSLVRSESGNIPGYEWTADDGHKEKGIGPGVQIFGRSGIIHIDWAAQLTPTVLSPADGPRLRHAPLYIQGDPNRPRAVDTLRFEYSLFNTHDGDELEVTIGDTVLTDCRPDQADGEWRFIECPLPPQVLNKAAVLQFQLHVGSWYAQPVARIDNISLERLGNVRVWPDGPVWHVASSSTATAAASIGSSSGRTGTVASPDIESAFALEERDVAIHVANSAYSTWNVSADAEWVSVSPAALTGDGGTVHVTMNLTGLEPGTHVATLRVTPSGWVGVTDVGTSVPIVLTIAAPESQPAQDGQVVAFENRVAMTPYGLSPAGQITLSQASLTTLPPSPGLSLPARAVIYRFASSSTLTGHAIVTLPFDADSLESGARPALVRLTENAIEDVTTGIDLDNGLVYGVSAQLGDFAVLSDTRPRSQFLAEGTTGGFFDEEVALANPHDTPAEILIKFLQIDRAPVLRQLTIPARSHHTIDVRRDVPEVPADASVVVQPVNGVEVITERTMTWDQQTRYGGHSGSGQTMPSVRWYFAEGTTGGPFDLWILLANPNVVEAHIRATFMKADSSLVVQNYVVAPQARMTIAVDAIPGLQAADVSTLIESTNGIAVYADRSMYWSSEGLLWRGGTSSPGVAKTSPRWLLAEGATGSFFELFLLLENPTPNSVPTQVTFLKTDGSTVTRRYDLPPTSRTTIDVDTIAGLEDTSVSMVVDTLDGSGIVAERAMYWGDAVHGWVEGHSSPGVTETGTVWGLAGGEVGRDDAATYILVANPSTQPAPVRVTFLREAGRPPVIKEFTIAPTSRFNIPVQPGGSIEVPELSSERFGALVESLAGVGIVVEHSVYWNANGVLWEGGTNGTAQRLK